MDMNQVHNVMRAIVLSVVFFTALFASLFTSMAQAQSLPERIDALTAQWLNISKQQRQLEDDWALTKPALQQRMQLLTAEKRQLRAILEKNASQQDNVAQQREQLLAQQQQLEHAQQGIGQQLQRLEQQLLQLKPHLPPLLHQHWPTPLDAAHDDSDLNRNEQLQVRIATIQRIAEFNQRITLHAGIISVSQQHEIFVKQLYLGSSFAWFTSDNGEFYGWGQADAQGWQWILADDANTLRAAHIHQAIAMYEKREPAAFIQLPVSLTSLKVGTHAQ